MVCQDEAFQANHRVDKKRSLKPDLFLLGRVFLDLDCSDSSIVLNIPHHYQSDISKRLFTYPSTSQVRCNSSSERIQISCIRHTMAAFRSIYC